RNTRGALDGGKPAEETSRASVIETGATFNDLPVDIDPGSDVDEAEDDRRVFGFRRDATAGRSPASVDDVALGIHRPGVETVVAIGIEPGPVGDVGVRVRGVGEALDLAVDVIGAAGRGVKPFALVAAEGRLEGVDDRFADHQVDLARGAVDV